MTKKEVTQLSFEITGYAIKVHKHLGPGLLESVYQKCLKYELIQNGYFIQEQISVPVIYGEMELVTDLRLDMLVNNMVIIELKTVEALHPVHEAQVLTYMKLLQVPQGLLINFYSDNITKTMRPLVNEYFKMLPDD